MSESCNLQYLCPTIAPDPKYAITDSRDCAQIWKIVKHDRRSIKPSEVQSVWRELFWSTFNAMGATSNSECFPFFFPLWNFPQYRKNPKTICLAVKRDGISVKDSIIHNPCISLYSNRGNHFPRDLEQYFLLFLSRRSAEGKFRTTHIIRCSDSRLTEERVEVRWHPARDDMKRQSIGQTCHRRRWEGWTYRQCA